MSKVKDPVLQRQKDLARLQKEMNKPKGKGYFAFFLLIVTVIYMADEIASQIGVQMQTVIASEIFAPVVGSDVAVARLATVGTFASVASALAFIYKPLSDKYGRRIFLIINTFGMGLGLLLISLATNIPVYTMGAVVVAFFIPHDMQSIYIQECAPAKHRGKIYSVIKSAATLAIFIIPFLRRVFIPDTDLSGWRYVYVIPAALAMVASVIALLCVRESDVFIANRMRILQNTQVQQAEKKASDEGGLINAFRYVFRNKQLLFVMLADGFLMFGMLITQYYETIMNYGFAQQYIAAGKPVDESLSLAVGSVSEALLLFSVGSAAMQLIPGFLADRFGRKKSIIAMSVFMLAAYLLFYFGSQQAWNEYLVGLFCGAAVGAFWSTGDMVTLICSESAPTGIRMSVATVRPIISGVVYAIGMLAMLILSNILGDAAIGMLCLCIVVPGMTAGILILIFKAKETKGTDLAAIRDDGSVAAEVE